MSCAIAHLNWSKFVEDADNVVPPRKAVQITLSTEVYAALPWLFNSDKEGAS